MFMRLVAGIAALAFAASVGAFDFDDVGKRAAALAAQSYKAPARELPKPLKDLSYDQYRDIRFKPARSLWRSANLPFEIQLFHPGLYYDKPVRISEIVNGVAREIRFDPEMFDYGNNTLDKAALRNLGFAGFRVHVALNMPKYKDEVLVFQGASYFRGLGKDQRYGLSARGLALDTGLASGEEFPHFTEFWIERPNAQSRELTFYALLDSESVAGAYRFVVRPGNETVTLVKARIFLRKNVAKLGIAPLTSMYFFGENQPRTAARDYRPEVHDSDILLVQAGTGEWITRPLVNPKRLLVTSFALTNPMGFGLMQRDRLFENYQDLEARYELRPSAWIEPRGNWGKGRVELVQIPTPTRPTTTSSRSGCPTSSGAAHAVRRRVPHSLAEERRHQAAARVDRADAAGPRLHATARFLDRFRRRLRRTRAQGLRCRRQGGKRRHRRRQRRDRREPRVPQRSYGRVSIAASRQAYRRQEASRDARVLACGRHDGDADVELRRACGVRA
jgi:glucan biosynthesis protein